MTACRCPSCSTDPSAKYSDAWRLETEARLLLSMPIEGRRKYLDTLKGARRETLEAAMKKLWLDRKPNPP